MVHVSKQLPARILRAPRRLRLAMQVGSAIAVAVAVTLPLAQRSAWPVSAALLVAASLVLSRGVRARVELRGDELVVRDYTFSTRIARDRILMVHRFPSIDWRGADGIPRETLVNAFNPQRLDSLGPTDAELDQIREVLERWLTGADAHHDATRGITGAGERPAGTVT